MVLFLLGTINEGNAQLDALQYPQYTQPLNLFGEGILYIFDTGKAWPWCVVHTFHWKETNLFFQPFKMPPKDD